jgi:glutaconate CoA-transferase subunit A
MVYRYERDGEHLDRYVEDSKTEDGIRRYLDRWIYGVSDHREYLELVGNERLEELRR